MCGLDLCAASTPNSKLHVRAGDVDSVRGWASVANVVRGRVRPAGSVVHEGTIAVSLPPKTRVVADAASERRVPHRGCSVGAVCASVVFSAGVIWAATNRDHCEGTRGGGRGHAACWQALTQGDGAGASTATAVRGAVVLKNPPAGGRRGGGITLEPIVEGGL